MTSLNKTNDTLFPIKDNMGRQVQENPLHLTPYEYI